jgi:hypothetical protein
MFSYFKYKKFKGTLKVLGCCATLAGNEQGLACSTGNRLPSARQPMPVVILMMKLRTKAQQSLSSPSKSNIEKQKLKHGFRLPVLRQTQFVLCVRCSRFG